MKLIPCWIVIVWFLTSCETQKSRHKQLDEFTTYQMLELGDGRNPKPNEILLLSVLVESLKGDTLHYVPDYNYYIPIGNHYLDSVWQQFEIGDRLELKTSKEKMNGYLNFYHLNENKDSEVVMNVKLIEAVSKNKIEQLVKEEMSKREVNELANIKNYLNTSQVVFEERDGIYRYQNEFTEGEPVKYGSQVSIHYKGSFLNGYVFDDTYKKEITPSFTFGQEYQLLEGIYTGISGMREGETVKLILPSRHAFGGDGSLAAIVPPYTAVIYEVNIVKVIN